MLTRVIAPVVRSLTKMSQPGFVSSATRLDAKLSNATFVPSGLNTALPVMLFASTPVAPVFTRVMPRVCMSPEKTGRKRLTITGGS